MTNYSNTGQTRVFFINKRTLTNNMENINFQEKEYTKEEIYKTFNPVLKEFWEKNYKKFTPPQKYSIVNISKRINTLVSSPTGSGKTLSAFTAILNEIVSLNALNKLENQVYCVYISPLKALGNDIEKNLLTPLKEIKNIYDKKIKDKKNKLNIKVATRTGDTPAHKKASMLKNTPHILITTPESFAIMLASKKFKEKLSKAKWVIVDEIHSLADNKRGSHLSLSLEILQSTTNYTRIGLSATVSPLKEVAKFLVGYEGESTRNCQIVDVNYKKKLEITVSSPVSNLITEDYNQIQKNTYKLIDELIQKHKTTIIFTNTRSATERVVHNLKDTFPNNYVEIGEEQEHKSLIGAHHGSLSYEHRKSIEQLLKSGELKAVATSTSLELGIDIGSIDLVILLSSPKSVARALQRIGRSGHSINETSKGKLIVMDRDDLVESSVLLKASLEKKLDEINIPKNPYDVLAQQIFGMVLDEPMKVEDLYKLIKRSYTYKNLEVEDFKQVINYLKGDYASLEDRNIYAKIWLDNGLIGKKGRLARVLYMTNIGTIPDEANVRVKLGKKIIGSISEPFLERLKKQDVFVLGGQTYEFQYAQGMTAFVKPTLNRAPTVPSWFSEMLPLSFELGMQIQKFKRFMNEYFEAKTPKKEIIDFINSYLYVDEKAANSIYEYFKEQFLYAKISHDKRILIENYNDSKNKYIIFHTNYGRRVNDVLSRAMGYIAGKLTSKDVEINISDNGFYLLLPLTRKINVNRLIEIIKNEDLEKLMQKAIDNTEILNRRFRHCAARSLMILRNYKGDKKSVSRQQLSSRLLISAVRRIDPNFIILKEAKREVLEDLMDIKNTKKIIQDLREEKITTYEIFTDVPSPFAFNLISMGYSDIMKMDDKQAFLKRMHEYVLAKISLKNNYSN